MAVGNGVKLKSAARAHGAESAMMKPREADERGADERGAGARKFH